MCAYTQGCLYGGGVEWGDLEVSVVDNLKSTSDGWSYIISCFFKVLSESVYHALELQGSFQTSETRLFVSYFDKFFDTLNVSKLSEGHFKRKEARVPYTRPDDPRFKVSTIYQY